MKSLIVSALVMLSFPAAAADYAVMLNDQERAALLELIDAAVKARGLDLAVNAVILVNKIKSAGVVTETKPTPNPVEPPK